MKKEEEVNDGLPQCSEEELGELDGGFRVYKTPEIKVALDNTINNSAAGITSKQKPTKPSNRI